MIKMQKKLELAGGAAILPAEGSLAERKTFAIRLATLRAQGHAVAADEIIESGQTTGEVRVIHYLSCLKCKEDHHGR
jgi:hypothetical protein